MGSTTYSVHRAVLNTTLQRIGVLSLPECYVCIGIGIMFVYCVQYKTPFLMCFEISKSYSLLVFTVRDTTIPLLLKDTHSEVQSDMTLFCVFYFTSFYLIN